jgi:hypothetical protein
VDGTFFTASCMVSGFLEDTYDKYPTFTTQVIMEYSPFTPWFANNLPAPLDQNLDFQDFLLGEFKEPWTEGYYSSMIYQYADVLMMTMPKPRYEAY